MQVEQLKYAHHFAPPPPSLTKRRVSVVITCYNHAAYLPEAIDSALAQTYDDVEVVVVDDGSTDSTPEIATDYRNVRYVRQHNQGLSAARNAGLAASTGEYVIFLDADDRLLPNAAADGMACFEAQPDACCVFGSHRRVDRDGAPLEVVRHGLEGAVSYETLLKGNRVGMHAAVMYRRSALLESGGFDPALPACEDYELLLRLARRGPLHAHDRSVADYRIHDSNMSGDARLMLEAVMSVLESQRPFVDHDPTLKRALARGFRNWKAYYGRKLAPQGLSPARLRQHASDMPFLLQTAPLFFAKHIIRTAGKAVVRRVRRSVGANGTYKSAANGRRGLSENGQRREIGWGDLRRIEPVSRSFGFDRGTPVDRFYIERFLATHAADVRGRVVEIGDDTYTRRFGGQDVTRSDVLHVEDDHPNVTLSGDLARAEHIPSEAFDCVVLTQTLQFIYETAAAIRTVHRILKNGGTVLATVPGISPIPQDQWGEQCFWSFTAVSIRRLFAEAFGAENVEVETHGNALAATAFIQGISAEELSEKELNALDRFYPVLLTVRATRRPS